MLDYKIRIPGGADPTTKKLSTTGDRETDMDGGRFRYMVKCPLTLSEIYFTNTADPEPDGTTEVALLAIIIDRLKSYKKPPQAGTFSDVAIEHLECAIDELKSREALIRNHYAAQKESQK